MSGFLAHKSRQTNAVRSRHTYSPAPEQVADIGRNAQYSGVLPFHDGSRVGCPRCGHTRFVWFLMVPVSGVCRIWMADTGELPSPFRGASTPDICRVAT